MTDDGSRIKSKRSVKIAAGDYIAQPVIRAGNVQRPVIPIEIGPTAKHGVRVSHICLLVAASDCDSAHFTHAVKFFGTQPLRQFLRQTPNVIVNRSPACAPSGPTPQQDQTSSENHGNQTVNATSFLAHFQQVNPPALKIFLNNSHRPRESHKIDAGDNKQNASQNNNPTHVAARSPVPPGACRLQRSFPRSVPGGLGGHRIIKSLEQISGKAFSTAPDCPYPREERQRRGRDFPSRPSQSSREPFWEITAFDLAANLPHHRLIARAQSLIETGGAVSDS
jgi:hypothetical protein